MLNTPEFKVGILVAMVSVLIGGMTMKVSKGPSTFKDHKKYWFELENAGGLVPNSAVKMAGIKVGTIEQIKLVNGRAKIIIVVDEDVPVTTSSYIEIRSLGILGDKGVELRPGDVAGEPLAEDSEIIQATDSGSIDKVVAQVGKIAGSLEQLGKTLTAATTGDGDTSSPIGRIILNIEAVTRDMKDMTGTNKQKLNDIIQRVADITETIDDVVNDESDRGLRKAWGKLVTSLNKAESAINNFEEISGKINNGQGTLGRLVNDEETVDKINTAIDGVNEFLGGAQDMETAVDYHTEFLTESSQAKSYLGFRIQPGLDRYYLIQVVDDPQGVADVRETTTSIDDGNPTVTDQTIVYKNKVKFSVMFAKNFYDFTVRGGILENAGGFGFDYYLMNRKLRWSLEGWGLSDAHMKTYLKYSFWKGIYVNAGVDNFTNSELSSPFIGAGLFLTNDDLKVIASQFSFSGN